MKFKRIAENSAWLLLDKVVRLGGSVALTIWMARTVGPKAFGGFGFATAVAAIVASVGTLGLQTVVMRDLKREVPERRAGHLGAALILRSAVSLVLVVGTIVSVVAVRAAMDSTAVLTAILVAAALPQVFDVFEWALLTEERARVVASTRIAVFAGFAVLRVFVILNRGPLEAFAAAILGEAACGSFTLWVISRRQGIEARLSGVQPAYLAAYARAAVPLVFAALFIQIYMRADQLMITQMLGNREAGLYAASTRIAEAWNFVPTAALVALAPMLTFVHQRSEAEFLRSLGSVIRILSAMSLGFALFAWIFAERFVYMLYGSDFAEVAKILPIHALGSVFVTIGVASGPYFVNKGMFRTAMWQTAVGSLINVLINVTVIPRIGIVGAAYATVISYAFSAFLVNAFLASTRPLFRLQMLLQQVKQ
jgi:PST family polysaccharide transporter